MLTLGATSRCGGNAQFLTDRCSTPRFDNPIQPHPFNAKPPPTSSPHPFLSLHLFQHQLSALVMFKSSVKRQTWQQNDMKCTLDLSCGDPSPCGILLPTPTPHLAHTGGSRRASLTYLLRFGTQPQARRPNFFTLFHSKQIPRIASSLRNREPELSEAQPSFREPIPSCQYLRSSKAGPEVSGSPDN